MKVVLENLTKEFAARGKKSAAPVIAVNNFSFEIPDGKLIGLLGPSGCGKSTTLNLISGLIKPTSGRIYFGDDDITELAPENRGVGLVFQNYALYPHLTVRQNITFPLENLKGKDKLTKEERNEKALAIAKLVQIDALMDRRPTELSGGQQQRVLLARALCATSKLILLDEPVSGLDPKVTADMYALIESLNRDEGITVIMISHDITAALKYASHILHVSHTPRFFGKTSDYILTEQGKIFTGKGVCKTCGKEQKNDD